jgi:hypothetical protein
MGVDVNGNQILMFHGLLLWSVSTVK